MKIKDLVNMVTKEITKLDKFCLRLQQNVDVLLGATRTLIKDICAFNKGYAVELKLKKESEGNMITRSESYLMGFHDCISKFDVKSTASIYEEQISNIFFFSGVFLKISLLSS